MNARVIIDAIVRQTTILLAQVATTAGARSPLSTVANQVFLDLVTELERQGLSKKVVADMFGLALRSYQQKVERLTESASERGVTLWEAIYGFLAEQQVAERREILRRFGRDDVTMVKSILRDLVESGLVYQRGRGEDSAYRVAPDSDLTRDDSALTRGKQRALAWVWIYRDGPLTHGELARRLHIDEDHLTSLLGELTADGRIQEVAGADELTYTTERCLIPLGDEHGWEAALVDHYQALVSALCIKLRNGNTMALPPDQVGGSTYSFDVWDGHPFASEVCQLLARHRQQLSQLRSAVTEYNQATPATGKPGKRKVTFYCGQSVALDFEPEDDVNTGDIQ